MLVAPPVPAANAILPDNLIVSSIAGTPESLPTPLLLNTTPVVSISPSLPMLKVILPLPPAVIFIILLIHI